MSLVPTVRNIWWMAMWAQDLPAGQLVARRIMDEPLVFYRGDDGKPSALFDRCAHRWAPLSKGKVLADGHIQCPYHGLEYDQHGVCVRNPHPNYKIPPMMRVRSYPLAEKHSAIWIWMGTGEPDASLIPDFGWLDPDAPEPIDRRNYLPMPCAWDLMVDNLLDTSHVAILHDGNLGNADMIDADTIVEQRGPRSLTVKRDYADIPNTTFFDALSFHKYPRGDINAWMSWDAPSCLTNNGWVKPPGGAMEAATGMRSCHFLTPETENTCHYHFAAMRWQPMRATPEEEAALMRLMADMRQQAFIEQDGVMIAGQQARILEAAARGEHLRPVLISADVGIERAHRILRQLSDEEQKEHVRT
jgi:phenylpropionate dioxygenase-like ring-hydroxylating dioxygenase large terminal subunit